MSNAEKLNASIAMRRGDTYSKGSVIMFLLEGDYCVQKTIGAVSSDNRVITSSWTEALAAFERFGG